MNDWKLTGSLMWIHGLRWYIPFVSFAITDGLPMASWNRKKCALVSIIQPAVFLFRCANLIYQLNNHPRRPGRVSNWIGYSRLLLF